MLFQSIDEIVASVHAQYPHEAQRAEFYSQSSIKELDRITHKNAAVALPALVEHVDSMNYTDQADDARLLEMTSSTSTPAIPLGHDAHAKYRLAPESFCLRSAGHAAHGHRPNVLPSSFVGLPSLSAPQDPHGIVFRQLGFLEHSADDGQGGTDWERTGFAVLARTTPGGRLTGVYIIFDMFPIDKETCERCEIHPGRDDNWGRLPGSDSAQFFGARLDKLDRLEDARGDFSAVFSPVVTREKPEPLLAVGYGANGKLCILGWECTRPRCTQGHNSALTRVTEP